MISLAPLECRVLHQPLVMVAPSLVLVLILGVIVMPPEFAYIKFHDARTAWSRVFRDSLKDHPGFKWVEDIYGRHRGTSAEVAPA